jgi:membrane protease YdiL (CAAX protease family)
MTTRTRDFPFYAGAPVRLSIGGWLLVLALTALGFAALVGLPSLWPERPAVWAGTALFVGLPLLGLRIVAGRGWTALFHRPTWRDVWIGLGCALLCIAVSVVVALVVMKTTVMAANPVIAALADAGPLDIALFYAQTGPQLLGEELVTIVPFLAVLTALTALKAPRWAAILAAWILTAAMFGALHLPTYDWRLVQAITVIGSARLALTVAYLATKNVWASTIAHVANDWTLFTVALVAFSLKNG